MWSASVPAPVAIAGKPAPSISENFFSKSFTFGPSPIHLELNVAATSLDASGAIKGWKIVPEKRKEITTEGGLNLNYKKEFLKKIIYRLKRNKSRVSLFIEPNQSDIKKAKLLNADCIEIHTGKFCNLVNEKKSFTNELKKIEKAVACGNKIGLEVHAGHGLTYESAKILSKIKGIKEFNIGHFLIGESIFVGLSNSIKQFKKIIK